MFTDFLRAHGCRWKESIPSENKSRNTKDKSLNTGCNQNIFLAQIYRIMFHRSFKFEWNIFARKFYGHKQRSFLRTLYMCKYRNSKDKIGYSIELDTFLSKLSKTTCTIRRRKKNPQKSKHEGLTRTYVINTLAIVNIMQILHYPQNVIRILTLKP